MLTSVGKKQISAAMAIFGSMPLPSSSTRIGALATTGMVLIITAIGKNASSSVLLVDEHRGDAGSPRGCRAGSPQIASIAVGSRLASSTPNFAYSVAPTSGRRGRDEGLAP